MIEATPKTRVAVTSIFPFEKRQALYVHIEGFGWDFPAFGPVLLHVGEEAVRMQYAGFANVDGTAALQLVPADPRFRMIQDIQRLLGPADSRGLYRPSSAYVERVSEDQPER